MLAVPATGCAPRYPSCVTSAAARSWSARSSRSPSAAGASSRRRRRAPPRRKRRRSSAPRPAWWPPSTTSRPTSWRRATTRSSATCCSAAATPRPRAGHRAGRVDGAARGGRGRAHQRGPARGHHRRARHGQPPLQAEELRASRSPGSPDRGSNRYGRQRRHRLRSCARACISRSRGPPGMSPRSADTLRRSRGSAPPARSGLIAAIGMQHRRWRPRTHHVVPIVIVERASAQRSDS